MTTTRTPRKQRGVNNDNPKLRYAGTPFVVNLRKARELYRLTQAEMTAMMGLTHHSHYQHWEYGFSKPGDFDTLCRLVEIFNLQDSMFDFLSRVMTDDEILGVNEPDESTKAVEIERKAFDQHKSPIDILEAAKQGVFMPAEEIPTLAYQDPIKENIIPPSERYSKTSAIVPVRIRLEDEVEEEDLPDPFSTSFWDRDK